MTPIDFNAKIREAHELRAMEMHRIVSGAATRLSAFTKMQAAAVRTQLSHLAHWVAHWNPRAHPFH
ncbi:MAG: hypothetical protein K9J74_08065 [Sulfuritalea sp.]|nr:hypothetical protein [Sulfuritalea sp.]